MTRVVHKESVLCQKNKFDRLYMNKKVVRGMGELRTVVNLSSKTLDESTWSSLNKGLNFAVAPKEILFKETICGVETALKNRPLTEAEKMRGEVRQLLKAVRPP